MTLLSVPHTSPAVDGNSHGLIPIWDRSAPVLHLSGNGVFACGSDPDADLRIPVHGVAGRHCYLEARNGTTAIIRGEGNVWVNEIPVSSRRILELQDVVAIGPVSFRFDCCRQEDLRARHSISEHLQSLQEQLRRMNEQEASQYAALTAENTQLTANRVSITDQLRQAEERLTQHATLADDQHAEQQALLHALEEKERLINQLHVQQLEHIRQTERLHEERAALTAENTQLTANRVSITDQLRQAEERLTQHATLADDQHALEKSDEVLPEDRLLLEVGQLRDELAAKMIRASDLEHTYASNLRELQSHVDQLQRSVADRDAVIQQLRDQLLNALSNPPTTELPKTISEIAEACSRESQESFGGVAQAATDPEFDCVTGKSSAGIEPEAELPDFVDDLRSELAELFRLTGPVSQSSAAVASKPNDEQSFQHSTTHDHSGLTAAAQEEPSRIEDEDDYMRTYMETLLARNRVSRNSSSISLENAQQKQYQYQYQQSSAAQSLPVDLQSSASASTAHGNQTEDALKSESASIVVTESPPNLTTVRNQIDREQIRERMDQLRSVSTQSVEIALASAAIRREIGGIRGRILLCTGMILACAGLAVGNLLFRSFHPSLMWVVLAATAGLILELLRRLNTVRLRFRRIHEPMINSSTTNSKKTV